MLILLAVIVVNVRRNHELSQVRKRFFDAFGFRAIGKMRMAGVEVETQTGEARFVYESAKVGGIAHLAGGVFHGDGYAAVVSMQNQMLERAEGRVALTRVGCFARASHVED